MINILHLQKNNLKKRIKIAGWGFLMAFGITANAQCTADFTADQSSYDPNGISFSDISPDYGVNFYWDFGDGTTSNSENPYHVYGNAGDYHVYFYMTDADGNNCSQDYIITVGNASSGCTVDFTTDPDANNPLAINFSETSPDAGTFSWDFGDGTTADGQFAYHVYGSAGDYHVYLYMTDQNGNNCSIDYIITVGSGSAGCTADFTTDPDANNPLAINFSETSPDVGTYSWDFGDGTTGTGQFAYHIYGNPGVYHIYLYLTDANGNNCSQDYSITVGNANQCLASFTSDPDPNHANGVLFSKTSSDVGTYSWDFGDGTDSQLENPSHIYGNAGTYHVYFYVTDSYGNNCSQDYWITAGSPSGGGCVAAFNTSVPDPNLPNEIDFSNTSVDVGTYSWDFGDGTTSSLENPSHTYGTSGAFHVYFYLTDANGANCSEDYWINVGSQTGSGCLAEFTTSVPDPNTPNQISFSKTSVDVGTYSWDFGDGTDSQIENPTHTYGNAGTYHVYFYVTDANGNNCAQDYWISVGGSSAACVANFNSSPSYGSTNGIDFYNSSTSATSYSWDFGDGTTSLLENPSHVYGSAGTFHVYFYIIDANGNNCSIDNWVNVGSGSGGGGGGGGGGSTCQANFTSAHTSALGINFANSSSGTPTGYFWHFGDNTTSSVANPHHNYPHSGIFNCCLTITLSGGTTCSKCQNISISGTTTDIYESENMDMALENYPNPFNGGTTVNYSISRNVEVELSVVDLIGKQIALLENANKPAGDYSYFWKAENVAEGMYFLQLKANNQITMKKIIITK